MWESQNGLCAVSGLTLTHNRGDVCAASIDRVDDQLGYSQVHDPPYNPAHTTKFHRKMVQPLVYDSHLVIQRIARNSCPRISD